METSENKTKFYMKIFIAFMVILSLVTAYIMAKNMNKDESKVRFKLTQDYKRIKKVDYQPDLGKGQKLYETLCARCHKTDGAGNYNYPPLSGSNLVRADIQNTAKIIVHGLRGEIKRGSKSYNGNMPAFRGIGHLDLAHIHNYIRIKFNHINNDDIVHPVEIVKAKIDTLTIKGPLTDSDIIFKAKELPKKE